MVHALHHERMKGSSIAVLYYYLLLRQCARNKLTLYILYLLTL